MGLVAIYGCISFRICPINHFTQIPEILFTFQESIFAYLSLGYITCYTFYGDQFSIIVINRDIALLRPDNCAVFTYPANNNWSEKPVFKYPLQHYPVIRIHNLKSKVRICIMLFRCVTCYSCYCRADILKTPLRIESVAVNDILRIFSQATEAFLALA